MKLTILQGLPGSGKTTRALRMVAAGGDQVLRVNRDDIREELGGGSGEKFDPAGEELVRRIRDDAIVGGLREGLHVVSDDTNLAGGVLRHLCGLAEKCGAEVEIVYLRTPVATCIARDAKRERSVGEAVIRRMADTVRDEMLLLGAELARLRGLELEYQPPTVFVPGREQHNIFIGYNRCFRIPEHYDSLRRAVERKRGKG